MRFVPRGIAVAILIAIPGSMRAQTSATKPDRLPLWATLSVGRGDLQVNCGICRRNDQSSWAADVSVGGWLNPRTTLGGELGAWRRGGDQATQRVMMVSGVSQMYPVAKVPAFVKLGVGLMGYKSTDDAQALSARSLALQVGFGVDIPVKGRYMAVPHVGFVQGFNNGLYLDAAKVTGAAQVKLLRFGLGVGVRP